MKIPWGFVFSRVWQDVIREPFTFITAVLCAALVCSAGPIVLGSKQISACFVPPWANQAVAMVSWKWKASDKDKQKVVEAIKTSGWSVSVREVPGEEVAREIESLAGSFGKEFSLGDPSVMPGYLEIVLSEECLSKAKECQAFFDGLTSESAVDSVYSGIAASSEARLWFNLVRRFITGLTVFFLVVMMTMVFLLSRLSFYRRMREIYLWDLLGASPLFKRLASYVQSLVVIVMGWFISFFVLLQLRIYWHNLEQLFGVNRSCWLSSGKLMGFSLLTFVVVACMVLMIVEWAFRRSWKISARMDWTWTD